MEYLSLKTMDLQQTATFFNPLSDSIVNTGLGQGTNIPRSDSRPPRDTLKNLNTLKLEGSRRCFKLKNKEPQVIKRTIESMSPVEQSRKISVDQDPTLVFLQDHEKFLQQIQSQWRAQQEHFQLKKREFKHVKNLQNYGETPETTIASLAQSRVYEKPPLMLPKIESNKIIKIINIQEMRKSRTAQEAQRESQRQESSSNIILPPLQSSSPASGTLQSFSQSKQTKSFLTRKPQAKMVSRIFSSKSDKN